MRRPSRLRRQTGQVLIVAALVLPVLLGISAIAIDVGGNFADQRALQRASDAGALAGASNLRNGQSVTLQTAQAYAWRDLGQAVPSSVSSSCSSVSTCKIGPVNGYTITATNPYSPHNTTYSPTQVVSVDITHVNPAVGFEAAIGFPSVTIAVHSAATAKAGFVNFPFALATRFLDLSGSSSMTAFGAVLVGQCDDNGKGDLVDGSANGGIRFNGGSGIDLASSLDPSGNYASAQAALLSTPGTATCTAPPNSSADGSSGWATFGSRIHMLPNSSDYNYYFGFNSGPSGCTSATSSQATCTAQSIGDGSWQDSCWTTGGKSVPIGTSTAVFQADSSGTGTITSGSASTCSGSSSHEGSYNDTTDWPGLPPYSTPADLAQSLGDGPQLSGGTAHALAGSGNSTSVSADQYFTVVSNNGNTTYSFAPGWYVFDGSNASLTLGNGGGITCQSGTSSHPSGFSGYNGCVFIFENGANLTGSHATINCADTISGDGNCAFQFTTTTTNGTVGSLSLGGSSNVTAHPITFTDASTGRTLRFPLIYSTQVASSLSCNSNPCAVYLSQSGSTFDVRGTFYAPYGVASFNANAAPVSGQIVADTIELQSGASAAGNGVAYNGNAVAPAALPAQLIE